MGRPGLSINVERVCEVACRTVLHHRPEVEDVSRVLTGLHTQVGAEDLLHFLQIHRVDQLWLRTILDLGLEGALPGDSLEILKQARRHHALSLMLRLEAADRTTRTLDAAQIPHVLFKGVQVADLLYEDAVLRPSADIDVLVAADDRQRAFEALGEAGFKPAPQTDEPDYEIALFGHGSHVDLHWHLLQPQRSRADLTAWILQSRQQQGSRWFPAYEATLVIMLLNPAITDHVTDRLIQAIDIDRFLRFLESEDPPPFDWQKVIRLLDNSGLKTAAWTMLEQSRRLFASPIPPKVEKALRPGPIRRRYLRQWLPRNPARLYGRYPLLVRTGFSLFLQDRPRDMLRAIRGTFRRQPSAEEKIQLP